MPHKCLWHRTVDPVHRHMIPIVRCPAKGPAPTYRRYRSEDRPFDLPYPSISTNLSARAPDCFHRSHHESTHHDRCPGNAGSPHRGYRSQKALLKSSCQLTGILIGTVCRSKSRHRHCGNRITGKAEQVPRLRHREQCQRGIQPAGNTDDDMSASRYVPSAFSAPQPASSEFLRSVFSLSAIPDGTNGAGSKYLVSSVS